MSSPVEQLARVGQAEPEVVTGSVAQDVVDVPGSEEALSSPLRMEPAVAEAAEAAGVDTEGTGEGLAHPLVQDLMLEPSRWRIWPAVAVLRWVQSREGLVGAGRRLVYRSRPSLGFAGSEVAEFAIGEDHLELTLNAPGLATAGSALPASDIARIIADKRRGGALSAWLDGPCDLFMQVLEAMLAQCNAPFALMTHGRIDAHGLVAEVVGHSAPLSAGANGALFDSRRVAPAGGLGLAGLFVGPISASGLKGLFHAFTGLPVRIEEFAGAEVVVARPSRAGYPMGMMLGARCNLPSAGIEVHIDGGSDPDAQKWAREPIRRRSLHFLASSYVGTASPIVRLFLWLDPGNAPPSSLDGDTALGGLAVLGVAESRVRLPLEN